MNTYIHKPKFRLNNSLCLAIIKDFENSNSKYDGITILGVKSELKNSLDLLFDDAIEGDTHTKTHNFIGEAVQSYVNDVMYHNDVCMLDAINLRYDCVQIQKYKANEGHYNAVHMEEQNTTCIGVGILYLNDIKIGGETEFPRLGVLNKPMCGEVIIFPPFFTHLHNGNMPISEDKYVITFVLHKEI